MRRDGLNEVINRSINQTLGRTIITAGTALMSALALFLFGGEVLRGFAFTMVVGIITGTYSTIFIAAAIVSFWRGGGRKQQVTASPSGRGSAAGRPIQEPESARVVDPSRCVTLLLAALLGIVQGVTEFLPISSTAHLLLIAEAVGFDDPGGVFTVMIQLGSIFAVVWVYRARLIGAAAKIGTSPEARHFAAAVIVATIPALFAGAFFADFIQSVLYKSPRVFAGAFIVGGLVMLLVERLRPAARRRCSRADAAAARARHRVVPDARAGSGRVAVWRDDCRRPCHGTGQVCRGRVFVFRRHPHDVRRIRA